MDLAQRQRGVGVDTQGGGGLWMVVGRLGGRLSWSWIENPQKKMDSNGGVATPLTPL